MHKYYILHTRRGVLQQVSARAIKTRGQYNLISSLSSVQRDNNIITVFYNSTTIMSSECFLPQNDNLVYVLYSPRGGEVDRETTLSLLFITLLLIGI